MRLSRKNIKDYLTFKGINKVIKILIFSDILMMGSFGLISPVFAVYITDTIPGGTLEVVGIASTIYLLTKSIGQLFAAEIVDRIKGERDDFQSMFIGSLVMCLSYLLYIFVKTPMQLYAVQFLNGLATAFTFPSWMGIFTRHVDKDHEGKTWGMYFTTVDLASAGTAAIGGWIAYTLGFKPLFILIVVIGVISSLLLLTIKDEMRMPKSTLKPKKAK
jgi:DHA2 family metal-tetracycline-proton antiporter-like MFS transporter